MTLCNKCGVREKAERSGLCKPCKNEKARAYYADNKERCAKSTRARYHKNKEKVLAQQRRYYINKKFKIDVETYDEMMSRSCESCGKNYDQVLDHCHATGEVRGVLCRQCNMALGLLGDDLDGVERLMKYITSNTKLGEAND